MSFTTPISIEKLLSFSKKEGECIVWTKGKNANGYGIVNLVVNGKKSAQLVHRVMWKLAHGDPGGLAVCHHCDNPPCFNMNHLFSGTKKENTHDMVAKGRARGARGVQHWKAKLSEQEVVWLKRLGETKLFTQQALADIFKISRTNARYVIQNQTWKHLIIATGAMS